MLRVQLLAIVLDLRNNSESLALGEYIRPMVDEAKSFLGLHPDPLTGRHLDRGKAFSLKDKLNFYNNSGKG